MTYIKCIVNKKKLAEALEKSERTITEWQKEGLPVKTSGSRGNENEYDLLDVIEWFFDREADKYWSDKQALEYYRNKANILSSLLNENKIKYNCFSFINQTLVS